MLKSYIPFTNTGLHTQYIPDSTAVLYISITYLGLHNLYIPDFISDCTYRLHTLDYIPLIYLIL